MAIEPIHLCLASNSNYYTGLQATILSACLSNPKLSLTFHIITDSISESTIQKLTYQTKKLCPTSELNLYQISTDSFEGFERDSGGSLMTYARLLIDKILDVEKLLFIDCDTLVLTDIRSLWEHNLEGKIIAAAQCPVLKILSNDCPWKIPNRERHSPYFNAGVMLIDLQSWRSSEIGAKTIELIGRDPSKCMCWDQTALNYVLKGSFSLLPPEYNRHYSAPFDPRVDSAIIHYMAPNKPWLSISDEDSFIAWHSVFRRLGWDHAKLLARPSFFRSAAGQLRLDLATISPAFRQITLWHFSIRLRLTRSPQVRRILLRKKALVETSGKRLLLSWENIRRFEEALLRRFQQENA